MSRTPFNYRGSAPNQFVTYAPDVDIPELRYPEDAKLTAYTGPIDINGLAIQDATLLPVPVLWDLESCVDWTDYRRNSNKGRRREHAFYLGARALKRPVVILQHMLDSADRFKYQNLLIRLTGVVLGNRYAMSKTSRTLFVLDDDQYTEIQQDLSRIHARTLQLLGKEGGNLLPNTPEWGNSSKDIPRDGLYSQNDWEIISATYRFEVEAWLKMALTFGYDFVPWQDPDREDKSDGSKEAAEEAPVPKTPKRVNPQVIEQLTMLRDAKLNPTRKRASISFFDLPDEEPDNPAPVGPPDGDPSDPSDDEGDRGSDRQAGGGRRDNDWSGRSDREDRRPLRPDGFPEPDPDKDPGGTSIWRDFQDRLEPWVKLVLAGDNKWINRNETHFDTKLKSDIIPQWDGNHEGLGRWILLINDIADRSASTYRGLGDVVPTRFTGKAASWWFSLPEAHRRSVMINWDTLKDEIRTYWMNQAYIDKMQGRAIRARYRQAGYSDETPSEYYIRKYEALALVYNFSPSQVMNEVLKKAPLMWSTVINPRSYENLAQFQTAIKYHEDLLIKIAGDQPSTGGTPSSIRRRQAMSSYQVEAESPLKRDTNPFRNRERENCKNFKPKDRFSNRQDNSKNPFKSKSQAVSIGANNLPKPEFPKDNSTVSEGKTPAEYGARGCIHCGSIRHWDRECRYAMVNSRKVRSMFADFTAEMLRAEAEYEDCYSSRGDEQQNEQGNSNSDSDTGSSYSEDLNSDEDTQISSRRRQRDRSQRPH
jgi:hypothetical protein